MKILSVLFFAAVLPFQALASSCLPGGTTFSQQVQVDGFPNAHPNCDHILGSVAISGNDITNLNALAGVKAIDGDLIIFGNPLLTNLTGISQLTWIGGALKIESNDSLTSIHDLEGFPGGELDDLWIEYNPKLTFCSSWPICSYILMFPERQPPIGHNAVGCNTPNEITDWCLCHAGDERSVSRFFSVYPNPATDSVTIRTQDQEGAVLTIRNVLGRPVLERKVDQDTIVLDLRTLPKGIYHVSLMLDGRILGGRKLVKN